jgi:hypothetical protein
MTCPASCPVEMIKNPLRLPGTQCSTVDAEGKNDENAVILAAFLDIFVLNFRSSR